MTKRGWLVVALMAAGCAPAETTVYLDADYDPNWQLESLQLVVAEPPMQPQTTDLLLAHHVEVMVPDEWAGNTLQVALWGLRTGQRFAGGQIDITPLLYTQVHGDVSLVERPCGDFCQSPPPSVCLNATTARMYDPSGSCSGRSCSYPMHDTTCISGCDKGSCLSACTPNCSPGVCGAMDGCGHTCNQNCWNTVAPMPTARSQFAAVAAADGRIYAIGGLDADGRSLNTVEVFDPASNRWTVGPTLPNPRAGLAAVSAPDHRIFVMGGIGSGSGTLSTVDVLTLPSSWTPGVAMHLGRLGLAAAVGADSRIYAIGGESDTGTTAAVEAYTLGAPAWVAAASFPHPTTNLSCATDPVGRIFAFGSDAIGSLWFYSPSANVWLPGTPMPSHRTNLGAALAPNGQLMVVGGGLASSPSPAPLNTVESYDPATDSWHSKTAIPTPRLNVAVTAGVDGRIYAMGGVDQNGLPLTTVEAYSP